MSVHTAQSRVKCPIKKTFVAFSNTLHKIERGAICGTSVEEVRMLNNKQVAVSVSQKKGWSEIKQQSGPALTPQQWDRLLWDYLQLQAVSRKTRAKRK
jgi:hypothetical protein